MISQLLTSFSYTGKILVSLPETYFFIIEQNSIKTKLLNRKDFKISSHVRLRDDGDIKYNTLEDYLGKHEYIILKSSKSGVCDNSCGIYYPADETNKKVVLLSNFYAIQLISAKWMTKTGYYQDIYNAGKIIPSVFNNIIIGEKKLDCLYFSPICTSFIDPKKRIKFVKNNFDSITCKTTNNCKTISSSYWLKLTSINVKRKYNFNSVSNEYVYGVSVEIAKSIQNSFIAPFYRSVVEAGIFENISNNNVESVYIQFETNIKNDMIVQSIYQKIEKVKILN